MSPAEGVLINEESRINFLREDKSISELKELQKYLTTLDKRSTVSLAPGSLVSVLQFVPLTASSVIQVLGFKTPKKIKNIDRNLVLGSFCILD